MLFNFQHFLLLLSDQTRPYKLSGGEHNEDEGLRKDPAFSGQSQFYMQPSTKLPDGNDITDNRWANALTGNSNHYMSPTGRSYITESSESGKESLYDGRSDNGDLGQEYYDNDVSSDDLLFGEAHSGGDDGFYSRRHPILPSTYEQGSGKPVLGFQNSFNTGHGDRSYGDHANNGYSKNYNTDNDNSNKNYDYEYVNGHGDDYNKGQRGDFANGYSDYYDIPNHNPKHGSAASFGSIEGTDGFSVGI